MASHIKPNLPEEFTAISEAVSTTGKYAIAYGKHFRPAVCFDIVCVNRVTGEAIRRHYNDREAEALAFWQEFHKDMTAKRGPSEHDERPEYQIFGPDGRKLN